MNRYVIIVAGGRGLRMGSEVPKQFLPVGGVPVLMRTIEAFRRAIANIRVVLVLPASQQAEDSSCVGNTRSMCRYR